MTTQTKLGNPGEGLFTIQDIDRALFTLDDIHAAIEKCLQGDTSNQKIDKGRERGDGKSGIIFQDSTTVIFSYPEGDIHITFTEEEGVLYRFFIDHPGTPHRVHFLSEMLLQGGWNSSQEQVKKLIVSINEKLTDTLFFSCGISNYSQIPVLHGVRTVFKKNGKVIAVNKLLRTLVWQDNTVFIEDEDFFIKIYACFKHITFDDGVPLSQEYAQKVRELRIPLEEKGNGRFSL